MKKLIMLACSIMLLVGCTNQNSGDLEKRIAALEKSSAVKDKQIDSLTQLAYLSFMDSTIVEDSLTFSKSAQTILSEFSLSTPKYCSTECLRRYSRNILNCQGDAECIEEARLLKKNCLKNCTQNPMSFASPLRLPDLIITEFHIVSMTNTFTKIGYTVKNIGSFKADISNVTMQAYCAKTNKPSLPIGGAVIVQRTTPTFLTPGQSISGSFGGSGNSTQCNNLILDVDSSNNLSETNESNNRRIIPVPH